LRGIAAIVETVLALLNLVAQYRIGEKVGEIGVEVQAVVGHVDIGLVLVTVAPAPEVDRSGVAVGVAAVGIVHGPVER